MIKKYVYGSPVKTGATVMEIAAEGGDPAVFAVERGERYSFSCALGEKDRVYGLGEQVRGINKRGWKYEGWNTDDPIITEGRTALYASHNFIVVCGARTFGVFFDCAGRVQFDIGYTRRDALSVTTEDADVYLIEGEDINAIIHEFRTLIGRSYIPPRWAFGYGQSRWGYQSEEDIMEVVEGYANSDLPLDMIYLDIDYMERFKDFTVDRTRFPDLKGLAARLKARGIRLVPIIDAAVKAEPGYSVFEEGVARGYFCKDAAGDPFIVGVWPGDSALPDVLNEDARRWFGEQYRVLLDCGIEGFWNDMNEPTIFYSRRRLEHTIDNASSWQGKSLALGDYNRLIASFTGLQNNPLDYKEFYHETEQGRIVHERVHNLYGYYMTRSAAEYFEEYAPEKRFLLFSRSSYIGMHRYGGVWTGDNASWWSHILLNLKMLPSLNMCGFLYCGADLGGFGGDTTEELLLRWLALGVFTPLMRNHATNGSRLQECYRFTDMQAFRNVLGVRYTILPYLYSEFVRCALRGEMLFRPLAFVYDDERSAHVEDQLLFGDSVMIAPVYEENAMGRYVYLPEEMKLIRMKGGSYTEEILSCGDHFIEVPVDEVVFFLRPGKVMPIAAPADCVERMDGALRWLQFIQQPTAYELCEDDGISPIRGEECLRRVVVEPQ